MCAGTTCAPPATPTTPTTGTTSTTGTAESALYPPLGAGYSPSAKRGGRRMLSMEGVGSTVTKRTGLLVWAVAVLLLLAFVPRARADNPPAPEPSGPLAQSLIDGCQRDPAALIAGAT